MRFSTLVTAFLAVALVAPAVSAQSRQRLTPSKPEQTSQSFTPGIVADGSFEAGTASAVWSPMSTNYGTPICSVAACGAGGTLAAAPRTGTFYVWFSGGAATTPAETGSVQQSVTVPAGAATLKFWLRIPAYTTPPTGESMTVSFGGTTLATYTYAANQTAFAQYTEVSLPITGTGAAQVLRFEQSNPAGVQVSYFVDDVSITANIVGPALAANPTSVAFGNVAINTPTTQTITLTNGGSTATTITSITASGAGFTVNTAGTNLTLAAGATTTFTVTFSPTTPVAATGSVSIVSNAPGSPLTIALTGTGTNASPPISFCSGVVTNLPAGQPATTTGPFGPYPNVINVTGITRPVIDVNIRLVGVSHTFPGDLDIFVQHPTGPTAILMSDAGGGTDLVSVNLTIDDQATAPFTAAAIVAGSYRPTDLATGDVYPAPAPAPSGTSLAAFNGASPNGAWNLYGQDDASTDAGTMTDWCVDITVNNPVAGEGTAASNVASLTATPNPVRSAARVSFTATTAQEAVTVSVYDVTGRQVATLFQGAVTAGQTVTASLDATALPSGVYVVRAVGSDVNLTQRVTVVR